MEILTFICVGCNDSVNWESQRKLDWHAIHQRTKDAGWSTNLKESKFTTKFGALDVSFTGLCPDCRAAETSSAHETHAERTKDA